jgi:pimeloyl-ACP methyl ester carboxylesterase
LAAGLIGLLAVVAALGLACTSLEAITAAGDAGRYPAPGQLVDVGGYRMHINCTGTGSPTVVLDAGAGGSSLDWNLVQPALSETTRVCSYDRAGLGWSDAGPEPRTPEQIATELRTLLHDAGIPGPYVLVGHSLAGKNVRMFELQHPQEVAGMVLVDARSEYVDDRTSADEAMAFQQSVSMQGMVLRAARTVGLVRLLGRTLYGVAPMPSETRTLMALVATSSRAVKASSDELTERASSDDQLRAAPSLGNLPLVVLAADDSMASIAFWPEAQNAQAALSTAGRLVVVEHSGHYIHWDHPAIVIDAVRDVIASIHGAPLADVED